MKQQSKKDIHRIQAFDVTGKKTEMIELDKEIFNGVCNESLLYHAIRMYRANTRRGTASSKTRAEVRGGGKKPWRQKGTGRARFGSIRNPLWRGGGIAFGPQPRDFRYQLPKQMKKNAFIASVNAKLRDGEIVAVEEFSLAEPKTKNVADMLTALKLKATVLLLVATVEKNVVLASRNIKNLTLKKVGEATALDVLVHRRLLLTKRAAELLNKMVR